MSTVSRLADVLLCPTRDMLLVQTLRSNFPRSLSKAIDTEELSPARPLVVNLYQSAESASIRSWYVVWRSSKVRAVPDVSLFS